MQYYTHTYHIDSDIFDDKVAMLSPKVLHLNLFFWNDLRQSLFQTGIVLVSCLQDDNINHIHICTEMFTINKIIVLEHDINNTLLCM